MGVPVVLVYLGFLHADEMTDCSRTFNEPEAWKAAVKEYSRRIAPADIWDEPLDIDGTPLIACIRSKQVYLEVH